MTARESLPARRLVNLREVPSHLLHELLSEEIAAWQSRLHWDFRTSVELLSRYVEMHALDGVVLMDGALAVGYCYWVAEERKALLGDLFVRQAWQSIEAENLLLSGALAEMREQGRLIAQRIRRVEGQLMQMRARNGEVLPYGPRPRTFERCFMLAPLAGLERFRPVRLAPRVRFDSWGHGWLDGTADLIAEVYRGHVDSQINDQYRTPSGARRFLQNIVHFPGCGVFSQEASRVALDESDQVAGCLIATRVAPNTGHVAQLCVRRDLQGSGAGVELLRQAMTILSGAGIREVSLTVTTENQRAVRLYERMGFQVVHTFEALVWDEFGSL